MDDYGRSFKGNIEKDGTWGFTGVTAETISVTSGYTSGTSGQAVNIYFGPFLECPGWVIPELEPAIG